MVTDAETKVIANGKVPARMVEVERERGGDTALYRWWGKDDPEDAPPAYIGISYDVLRREAEHNADLREFMDGDVRRTVEWWGSRKAALEAEKAAILAEKPRYNVQHNQRNPRRAAYRRPKPAGPKPIELIEA